MPSVRPLKIGITCYPTVGGSGILATKLGLELAHRGHEIHFISYDQPFHLPVDDPRVQFHQVQVNGYDLFKYPDYTLPLSVKMAEVSRAHTLDILHVHYAVPHATAAILARQMLPEHQSPKIITTLHGTDTTLLGRDAGYIPAIRHALERSDAITTVSHFLQKETTRAFSLKKSIEVIHNFFDPEPGTVTRAAVRRELGVADDETLLVHASNLRTVKRVDLLLATIARLDRALRFKLLVLAGSDFHPFMAEVKRLGLTDRVIVRERVTDMEAYLLAADLGVMTSESESFCLSILEAMSLGCPSVAFAIGGIPEVVESGVSGELVPFGDTAALAAKITQLIRAPSRRRELGRAAQTRASTHFTAAQIVPLYEDLYQKTCDTWDMGL